MFPRTTPPAHRAALLAAVLVVLQLLLAASSARADPDVVFLTTTSFALASNIDALKTACAAVQSNATALISPATDTFAGVAAAAATAGAAYAYVSATMDTTNGNLWLWRRGGDVQVWDSIVTSGKWAATYPVDSTAEPYAVYSASLGALINVDGTAAYPIACMYNYYVEPAVEVKAETKKKFPWWAILIIVLGSVAVVAAVVTVVVCCCCCKKNKDGAEAADEEHPSRSEGQSRSTAQRSNAESGSDSDGSSRDSEDDSSSNRSFSTESAKEARNGKADGRPE